MIICTWHGRWLCLELRSCFTQSLVLSKGISVQNLTWVLREFWNWSNFMEKRKHIQPPHPLTPHPRTGFEEHPVVVAVMEGKAILCCFSLELCYFCESLAQWWLFLTSILHVLSLVYKGYFTLYRKGILWHVLDMIFLPLMKFSITLSNLFFMFYILKLINTIIIFVIWLFVLLFIWYTRY